MSNALDASLCAPTLFLMPYLLSYLVLNAALAAFLWANSGLTKAGWADAFLVASALNKFAAKFAFACVLFALAGLPPFHSFPLKVAVLAVLARGGVWAALAGLVAALFCSWYVYQAFAFRVLLSSETRNLAKQPLSAPAALFIFSLLAVLMVGFCLLDDLLLVVYWLF